MQLRTLTLNNFYSFKHAVLDVSKLEPGIIQIQGINKDSGGSNGSGKSTVFEAIIWGLFGKTIRKSNEEALINVDEGNNCFVILEIYKEGVGNIRIERKKKPTALDVSINGSSMVKENMAKTQEALEELLDISYKSFIASVVFGQHADIDFLSASKEDKRLIVKNCLNLDTIFDYRDKIKEMKSEAGNVSKSMGLLITELTEQAKNLENYLPNKKYKYIELPPLSQILKAEKKISENALKIKSLKSEYNDLNKKKSNLEDTIGLGTFSQSKECPVCKNNYKHEQSHDDVLRLTHDLQAMWPKLKDLETKIEKLEKENKKLTPEYSSLIWDKINEKNKKIKESDLIKTEYESLVTKINNYTDTKNKAEMKLEALKYWEKAFSEQGLIRYIIKNILEYLNSQVNKFLSILTNNAISLVFDEELEELITANGREIKFMSLSGGEKRKVNLAVMLALQSVQRILSKNNFNIIFFDEIGENVDEEGIQGIYNLLNSMKQDENKIIFLITHNIYLKNLLESASVLTIMKTRGESKIITEK